MRERRAAGTDAVNTKVSGSAKARAGSAKDLVFGMGGACVVLAALAVLLLPRTKGPTVAAPAPGSTAAAEGSPVSSRRVFTPEALAVEGGGDKGVLLLAILGDVYDVTAGANHYGSGASYNCFVGRDATRAFVSGRFQGDGLTDDIKGLDGNDLEGIVGWHEFYMTSEKYHPVGVVVGRYYDAEGKSRAELDTIHATVDMWKRSKEKDKVSFPPCNSRWAAGKSEVWCTSKSGGAERGWVGYPRKMFKRGAETEVACTCVKDATSFVSGDTMLEVYPGCAQTSDRCDTSD